MLCAQAPSWQQASLQLRRRSSKAKAGAAMAEDASEGASAADPSGSATYDESIDEHYIQQLTIESVKYCKSCKHASNEPNPLTAGSHCRSGKYPCYPWWQGTYSRPVGLSCRLCMLAFTLGCFDAVHRPPGGRRQELADPVG